MCLIRKFSFSPLRKNPLPKPKNKTPKTFCDFINFNFVIEWIIPSQIPKYMS